MYSDHLRKIATGFASRR